LSLKNLRKPIQSCKNFLRTHIKSPAYRVVLKVANYNRRLLLLTFNGNLLGAFLEGSTFGVIYLALRVLEEGSLANVNQMNWLAPYTEGWGKGQLFISLITLAIVMQFMRSALTYLGLVSAGYLNARVQAQMKQQVFQRIMSFSFTCASGYKIGDLTSYINQSQLSVQTELKLWNQLLVNTFVIIAYIIVLVAISPILSVVAIILGAGLVWVQRFLIPRIKQMSREIAQGFVQIDKEVIEKIQALRLIHTFGRQKLAISRVNKLLRQLVPFLEKQQLLLNATQPLNQSLTIGIVGILLILGFIILSSDQALVIPALFTFIAALNRLSGQLGGFANVFNGFANNSGNMERLNEILIDEDKEWARFEGKVFKGLTDQIQFREVSLQYFSDQTPALQNLNFTMLRGSVTALVGGSGAGKSSIADLLTGLYDPTQGKILIDGVDLQQYSLVSWRERLGVVSQDTFVFNDAIMDNIRYGKPEATEEEVIAAAQDAQAHDFIKALPEGYQTVVGERGYRLSGGQRQRLALARAILKQPEVLILDEATSALDSQSERLVQQALAMFQEDRTVLVVAHRLSTIVNADQILVLEQGEIVERGTHQELLSRGEHYAHYWQLQAQGEVAVS
jgi:ATP-binding cassette subfamily B protein/subfamily B ATP-binding cassette protein MsbA